MTVINQNRNDVPAGSLDDEAARITSPAPSTQTPASQKPFAQESVTTGPIVVVVPTYNERENLPRIVRETLALGPQYRLIVVDDNSPDGTGALADELAATYPGRLDVIHRAEKQGIGPAYVAGFKRALATDARLIATMDADHSHDPAALPVIAAATAHADLVLGSRYVPGGATVGWPIHRQLLSRFGGRYARIVLGVPINDLTGGFKVYRRETLAQLDLDHLHADGYGFQIETTWRVLQMQGRVVEVPITFSDRVAGASKISRRIVAEAALLVWRLRFEPREPR
jgi:dolichol-phosphate mannosyltransferase